MKREYKNTGLLFLIIAAVSCNKQNNNTSPIPIISTPISCLPQSLQPGVMAFYPFNSGSINDFSGHNHHLTNPSTAISGPDRNGNPNCAFNFTSATNDFLKLVSPVFLDNIQYKPFSIALWYKPTGLRPGTDYETLISRDTLLHCPNTQGQWSIGLYDCRRVVFGINQNSIWDDFPIGSISCDSAIALLSNKWHHLVVTSNGSTIKLYQNGTLINQTTGTVGCTSGSSPTLNTGDLFIGKNFNGLIDDIIIYNKVLSASEIVELKNLAACCQ